MNTPRNISPFRIRTAQRSIALALLFSYVLGGSVPLFHHHSLAVRLTPDEGVTAHTCGEVERHIPLDAVHGCALCVQSNQREFLPVEGFRCTQAVVVTGTVPDLQYGRLHPASQLLPDKRGPPVVA